MKKLFLSAALVCSGVWSLAQEPYVFTADLYTVQNDRVRVRLWVPADLRGDVLEYVIPKVVPGTYEDYYFGRYVEDFQAFDLNGSPLPADSIELGTWRIQNTQSLSYITYFVNDSFDDLGTDNFIFQPGGTHIEADQDYVVNTFGFFGYFEGHRKRTFEVHLTMPSGFYPAASWDVELTEASVSVGSGSVDYDPGRMTYQMSFPSYFLLSDTPILVAPPDTTSFYVGTTRIGIATYSEGGNWHSKDILPIVQRLATALANFFGELPAQRYDFLFFFADNRRGFKGGFGALEHLQSSFYYLPDMQSAYIAGVIRDVCAHEFLHILSPLNLHSEEIAYFDFRAPEMSQHLWLYEGTTEYFAHLVQLQDTLITPETFLETMREKVANAARYGEYSFTENSRNILDPKEQAKYLNVYEKGAVIAWMLDLKLRQLSDGRLTLKDLLLKMKEVYGPERPFKDEQLFAELARYSGYPEVESWLQTHVAGDKPLPMEELLGTLGYTYQRKGGSKPHAIVPVEGATAAQQAAWAAFCGG